MDNGQSSTASGAEQNEKPDGNLEQNLQGSTDGKTSPEPSGTKPKDRLNAVSDILAGIAGANEGDKKPAKGETSDPIKEGDAPASGAIEDREGEGLLEDKPPAKGDAPKTLADLADATGFDPAKLYDMTLKTGDGEEVTLGALKDLYQGRETVLQEIAETKARADQRDVDTLNDRQLWADIGDNFHAFTTPQQRQKVEEIRQQAQNRERHLLAQAAPELNNAQAFEAFSQDAAKLLASVGYKPHEMNMVDHRQVLLVRMLLKGIKFQRDLGKFKPKPVEGKASATTGRQTPASKSKQIQANARSGKESDRIAAVSDILKRG